MTTAHATPDDYNDDPAQAYDAETETYIMVNGVPYAVDTETDRDRAAAAMRAAKIDRATIYVGHPEAAGMKRSGRVFVA